MRVSRTELDEWIKKLKERGIDEFEFRDLPNDLKHKRGLQKAKGLGLLERVKTIDGRHTWKIVPSNISKTIYKIPSRKICTESNIKE